MLKKVKDMLSEIISDWQYEEENSYNYVYVLRQVVDEIDLMIESSERSEMSDLIEKDLTVEQWREYEFGGRVYHIENPVKLIMRPGGTTHRVVTPDGITHCVPAPGENGCVLRWKSKDEEKPVAF